MLLQIPCLVSSQMLSLLLIFINLLRIKQILEKSSATRLLPLASALWMSLIEISLFLVMFPLERTCRPIILRNRTKHIFQVIHGLSHPGYKPTWWVISSCFVWHSLKHDVHRWSQERYKRQASKIQWHVYTWLVKVPPPDRSFGSIHVDIIGSLPASENKTYPFTIVNHFTHAGQIKAIPRP